MRVITWLEITFFRHKSKKLRLMQSKDQWFLEERDLKLKGKFSVWSFSHVGDPSEIILTDLREALKTKQLSREMKKAWRPYTNYRVEVECKNTRLGLNLVR